MFRLPNTSSSLLINTGMHFKLILIAKNNSKFANQLPSQIKLCLDRKEHIHSLNIDS